MTLETVRSLLIVEDDLALQKQIKWSLDRFESVTAHDRSSALLQLRKCLPAVVTMDLGLPPDADSVSEGLKLLEQVMAFDPDIKVIVLTGQNDQANALRAVAMGAYDFFAKPFEPELLNLTVERAFRLFELQTENKRLRELHQPDALAGLTTRDPQMMRICRTIEKVATSNATVMLLGESGTGKEVLARGLHQASPRRGEKFVAINCAAIPENLLESELFGYEKGAFTGAQRQTLGKIELAHGGTFFLDEIGDMAMALQAKLLRFLQERVIERVGGRCEIGVDVRIVCATHRNLKVLVDQGQFREDLFYRLSEIVLVIPPLRERIGDSVLLAQHFKHRFCASEGRSGLHFSPDALAAIEAYEWPGNVREMENCIKRAVIMSEGMQITALDLGLPASVPLEERIDLREARDAAEYRVMVKALARSGGNIAKAAEMLGVSRPTLYDLMNHHGIK